jgi:hypothetical protein
MSKLTAQDVMAKRRPRTLQNFHCVLTAPLGRAARANFGLPHPFAPGLKKCSVANWVDFDYSSNSSSARRGESSMKSKLRLVKPTTENRNSAGAEAQR